MKARMLVGLVGVVAIAAAAAQACGGEAETPAVSADSGTDAATGSPSANDAATADADAGAACDPTADFTKDIPDAAINDGGSTSGLCIGCIKTSCAKSVEDCGKHCPCQEAVGTLLACYVQNTDNPLVCAASIATADQKTTAIATALLPCVQTNCPACLNDGGI